MVEKTVINLLHNYITAIVTLFLFRNVMRSG
jgi:hypothetical protein